MVRKTVTCMVVSCKSSMQGQVSTTVVVVDCIYLCIAVDIDVYISASPCINCFHR